jgi:quercetin dioxygenase-like cupin family protein
MQNGMLAHNTLLVRISQHAHGRDRGRNSQDSPQVETLRVSRETGGIMRTTDDQPCCGTFPPSVLRPAELTAFSRGGGARTIPLVTRARGAAVFLSGQTLFDGGAGIPLHVHNCPESVVILEGNAIVEIDGQEHAVTTFDTTYVDAGVPHRLRNASHIEPMRILWIYASIDATRTIVDTGVTTRVDAEHNKA